MASSSAVQTKARFFHHPLQSRLQEKKSQQASADTFEAPKKTKTLRRMLAFKKAEPLKQGDEVGRKGGIVDCLAIFGALALCCACFEGSGNNGYRGGYRNRGWAKKPENQPKPKPPATQPPATQPLATQPPATQPSTAPLV